MSGGPAPAAGSVGFSLPSLPSSSTNVGGALAAAAVAVPLDDPPVLVYTKVVLADGKVLVSSPHEPTAQLKFDFVLRWRPGDPEDFDALYVSAKLRIRYAHNPFPFITRVREWLRQPHNQRLLANIFVLAGTSLTIVGAVLTPVTLGASLAVTIVGGALVLIGTAWAFHLDDSNSDGDVGVYHNGDVTAYSFPATAGMEASLEAVKAQQQALQRAEKEQREYTLVLFKEMRRQACQHAIERGTERAGGSGSQIRMDAVLSAEFIAAYDKLIGEAHEKPSDNTGAGTMQQQPVFFGRQSPQSDGQSDGQPEEAEEESTGWRCRLS